MSFGLTGRKSTCSLCKNAKKWKGKRRNSKIGDIVVEYQNNDARNHWPMGRIINVNSNKKGLVCSVLLCMGEQSGNKNSKKDPLTK